MPEPAPITGDQSPDEPYPADDETWRQILEGRDPGLQKMRGMFLRIPSNPRCKICAAPFGGAGGGVMRVLWHAPSRNPLLCRACSGQLKKHPGGAQLEIAALFADVRGSTAIAEEMSPVRFRNLLTGFYRVAWEAITNRDGIVDKYMGDGIMALFIPGITGEQFTARAVAAGQDLLAGVARLPEPRLPVGAGIHFGTAWVGVVGSEVEQDFTALGDVVNVAARLGSEAKAGELLVSSEAARAAALTSDATPHLMELKGRHEPLEVISL
jgi:adenylate cyclase